MSKTPDGIIGDLCAKLKSSMRELRDVAYEDGYEEALKRAYIPSVSDENLDVKSITDFAAWCYVHGIDFSYMGNDPKFVDKKVEEYLEYRKRNNKEG